MYEQFYKLTSKPFQLSPDPSFFFSSRGHKRAMAYLRYGLTQGEGFIVVTGGIGTGKTTLVETLFATLQSENLVAARLVTTQLAEEDMLRMVAAAFGLDHSGENKATLLKNVENFLKARAREGKRVLLVVDEAQNLPPRSLEELRMLSNFQLGKRGLLQSFLLGQDEFLETLHSPGFEQLRQRVIASCSLNPFDLDELSHYIEHRLAKVGWQHDPKLTPEAYAAIHRYTGGIPRRINTLCDRLMLYGFLEEIHEFTEEVVKAVTEELKNEMARPATLKPTSVPRRVVTTVAGNGVAANVADVTAVPASAPVSALSDETDVRQRLVTLEQRVNELESRLNRDRERLLEVLLKNFEMAGGAQVSSKVRAAD
jgi:general secretion pathway protein A